jgi:hypothetical protein
LGENDCPKVKGYTNPSRFEVFVELLLSLGGGFIRPNWPGHSFGNGWFFDKR